MSCSKKHKLGQRGRNTSSTSVNTRPLFLMCYERRDLLHRVYDTYRMNGTMIPLNLLIVPRKEHKLQFLSSTIESCEAKADYMCDAKIEDNAL